jgi:hypothetical protein
MRVAGSNSPLVNFDHGSDVDRLASKTSLSDASRLVNDTVTAIGRLEKNVNARLLTEVLLLDWPTLS